MASGTGGSHLDAKQGSKSSQNTQGTQELKN